MVADMRNFRVPEDRLDQKLTFPRSDGCPIEGDLDLRQLTRLVGMITFVVSIALILFLAQSSLFWGKLIPPWNTKAGVMLDGL